jgi:acyl-CoA hydrolase
MISLSLHLGATYEELAAAGSDPDRLLVIEVNPNLPRTCSLPPDYTNALPLDMVDVVVEADGAPYVLPPTPPDDVDRAIAEQARSFIGDGATLQFGIGAVPDMVATQLAAGTGGSYGIHTEMFTDGLMRLHLAGKVTNDAKRVFNGVSIATFALGSSELYRWLDGNRDVAFVPVQVVNDPTVIARNHSFVSVNGALSVDLYSQVVADHIDGKQLSGVGGHEDFVAGAEMRLEDHSLICMRSTSVANGVTRSRIVPLLPAGSVVSTPRHHTGVVNSEYGAADLAGRTVRERAAALAQIAHPDFRDGLADTAEALGRP